MNTNDIEVREFWNQTAQDWHIHVGEDGDSNRLLNSDPILWKFMGEVKDIQILDAGCGTGYLTRKLAKQGAFVTGVDISPQMVEIARERSQQIGVDIKFYVDSCSQLNCFDDAIFDLLVSNYVLMDIPDLESTMQAFNRVLKIGGNAILIFSHPCFPQGKATITEKDGKINYEWGVSYFKRHKRRDPPWGHFTSDFISFHRPLSDYWKSFKASGFEIIEFEEPRITEDRFYLAQDARKLHNAKTRPYSVAFKLQKK